MLHKNIVASDRHGVHSFAYANAATRLAATGLTTADVGKVAWQQSDDSFWVLKDDSPLTWVTLGASGTPTLTAETDADVVAGQPVYIKASGHLGLAESTALPQARCAGLVTADTLTGVAAPFSPDGTVNLADWTAVVGAASLTPGAEYFLAATAGQITDTAPSSGYLVRVGRAISATVLDIEIHPIVAL